MKKYLFVAVFLIYNTGNIFGSNNSQNRAELEIVTNKGNMRIVLYNETPLHRDNFIKLTKQRYFDNTLFHRVIKDFMIQGGDPESRNAKKGKPLGNGGPRYRIDAEFVPNLIHKKGALAAARTGDNMNPKKKSSGSQFYLSQGKVFTEDELKNMEVKKNSSLRSKLIAEAKSTHKKKIDSLISLFKKQKDTLALAGFIEKQNEIIDSIVDEKGFHFTPLQKKYYTTIGGIPHLDGNYTVFGEIIKGFSVLDSISVVSTDEGDRPIDDVVIKSIRIIKNYK